MRFVVLGDLHYARFTDPTSRTLREEFFDRLFTSVKHQQADVVFAIGDTTDHGYPDEFEGLHHCARRNNLEFITVNGNHDVLELTKQEISRYTGNRFPYFALHFNPQVGMSDVTDKDAARFLVLDTPKERQPKDHGGYVGAEQLAWLENQIVESIIESADQPLFVFGHHPVARATRWSSLPMLSIDNSSQVRRVFSRKQEGRASYFCGHNHANSIDQRANWSFIQTAAPLRTGDFRVIDFTPEEVSLETVAIEGGKATYLLARKVAEALGDFSRAPSRGLRRDREMRLRLASRETALR